MSNNIQVVRLCEDNQHFHFARKYLEHMGVNRRKIHSKTAPLGQGSGAQYVIDNYANELQVHRSKNYQKNIALVVLLDEDTLGVKNRLDALENAVKNANLQPRQKDEKVALFVPVRNIETWLYYAETQQPVDDKEDYKKHISITPGEAAKKLAEDICPNGLPNNAPSSLHDACLELKRLKL